MKRLLTFCLAILFCLFFSGCYLDDFTSSEQNKQYDSAIKIFKEYLAKTDPNAKIKEVSSEKYLGENHQMQLTEFVSGETSIPPNGLIYTRQKQPLWSTTCWGCNGPR